MTKPLRSIIQYLPIATLIAVNLQAWFVVFTDETTAWTWNKVVATVLIILNLILLKYRLNWGIAFTGVLILLWMFGLLWVSYYSKRTSFFVNLGDFRLGTPRVEVRAFFVFALYCLIFHKEIGKSARMILNLIDYGRLTPPAKNEKEEDSKS
jgi:hypothetical protein